MKYYECGICDHLHPWEFNGDCRDDSNRLTFDDIPPNSDIQSMDERILEDLKTPRLKWFYTNEE